ncbi:MAG: pyridoxal-phosphate dependent enzyme [Micromonosporaceae bacterium]|nr:pyridoxal-phosphate dependent enzyme [Micromonosporaceae bacterium]
MPSLVPRWTWSRQTTPSQYFMPASRPRPPRTRRPAGRGRLAGSVGCPWSAPGSIGALCAVAIVVMGLVCALSILLSTRTPCSHTCDSASAVKTYRANQRCIWRCRARSPCTRTPGRRTNALHESSPSHQPFVQSVGTAASLRGVSAVLRRHRPSITIVAVEPAESAVLSGGPPGAHRIEGIGIGYRPPLWDPSIVDEIVAVSTDQAQAMARRLSREEGLFTGTSSGANVVAAIEVGRRLGPGSRVATLLIDSGLKYLSTEVYRREELPEGGASVNI